MQRTTLVATMLALGLTGVGAVQAQPTQPPQPLAPPSSQAQPRGDSVVVPGAKAPQELRKSDTEAQSPKAENSGSSAEKRVPSGSAEGAATPDGNVIASQSPDETISSQMIGKAVVNAKGETIGTLDHLILDKELRVTGVILAVGGFLGIGSKDVALPMAGLDFREVGGKTLIEVSATEEELAAAPRYMTLDDMKAAEESAESKMPKTAR